jgi:hypothetical protein
VIDVGHDFQTMQDYIVGRLSDAERQAFEDRLVRDPELVREFEQSLRMCAGLQQLRAQGYLGKVAARRFSFRTWLPALAVAAVAGLALFLGLARSPTGNSPVLMASSDLRAASAVQPLVTAHFTFVSLRGASTPDLDLPAAGLIEFRAAPATRMRVASYRVTLLRRGAEGSSQAVGTVAGLALSTDGYVHCYADASRLVQGSYVLRIEPDMGTSDLAATFPFNLRARGAQPSS